MSLSFQRTDLILLVAVFCYGLSLILPGVIWDYHIDFGYEVLTSDFAWLYFASYANPLSWIALFLAILRMYKAGIGFSLAAFFFGLSSFKIIGETFGGWAVLPADVVMDLGIGFYVWELSFILLAVYCYLKSDWQSKSRPQRGLQNLR